MRQLPGFRARRVLITGAGPSALRLARAFHETGHHVTVAAYQPNVLPLHIKWSIAVSNYLRLTKDPSGDSLAEYVAEITYIVDRRRIELWVDATTDTPYSALCVARSVIERKTNCIVFAPHENAAMVFLTRTSLLRFAADHDLPVPESYEVKSRDEIHRILNRSRSNGKQRYILNETNGSKSKPGATKLPRRTISQTYDEVSRIKIARDSQLRLDQTLEDRDKYQSTSVVVRGRVEAFAACKLNHADIGKVSIDTLCNPVGEAMLQFHQSLASKLSSYTGHLSIDFCVDEKLSNGLDQPIQKRVLPVDGRCTPDTALLSFQGAKGSILLARSYIAAFGRSAIGVSRDNDDHAVSIPMLTSRAEHKHGIYSLGRSFWVLLFAPLLSLMTLSLNLDTLFYALGAGSVLAKQVFFSQEVIYNFKDPLPFFYFYLVFVPAQLVWATLRGIGRGRERLDKVMQELTLMCS